MSNNAAHREHPKTNKTSLALVAFFIDLLRNHFSFNTDYKYDKDISKSRLSIESSFATKSEGIGKRPAIYVKRGSVQYAKFVLGNRAAYVKDGTTQYAIQQQGYITFLCLSSNPEEAELLSTEVAEFLQGFCLVIANEMDFLTLNVEAIGDLGILEEQKEIFAVPVNITYASVKSWGVWQESVKLKKIISNLHEALNGTVAPAKINNPSDPRHVGINAYLEEDNGGVVRYPENAVQNEIIFDETDDSSDLANYEDC